MHYKFTLRKKGVSESTITAKGRTAVRADVRALALAKPGTRLIWSVMPVVAERNLTDL